MIFFRLTENLEKIFAKESERIAKAFKLITADLNPNLAVFCFFDFGF